MDTKIIRDLHDVGTMFERAEDFVTSPKAKMFGTLEARAVYPYSERYALKRRNKTSENVKKLDE